MLSSLFLMDKHAIFWINQYYFVPAFLLKLCDMLRFGCAAYSGFTVHLAPAYALLPVLIVLEFLWFL